MYRACLSCGRILPGNQSFELLPTGRRVAFDGIKGRLWILCHACRSWNLAPLEQRWEAVEAAERLFEHATVSCATENIALGKLPEGLELIRIGKAKPLEIAGWRYGASLLARRRGYLRTVDFTTGTAIGASVVAVGGVVAGFPWAAFAASSWVIAQFSFSGVRLVRDMRRPVLAIDGQDPLLLSSYRASKARLVPTDNGQGWVVEVSPRNGTSLQLHGSSGLHLLRKALPLVNEFGGTEDQVIAAVEEVESHGSTDAALGAAAARLNTRGRAFGVGGKLGWLDAAPPAVKIAVEIAANDETERRALAGEVAALEREWKMAEELAAISDSLLIPDQLIERIRGLRGDFKSTRA